MRSASTAWTTPILLMLTEAECNAWLRANDRVVFPWLAATVVQRMWVAGQLSA